MGRTAEEESGLVMGMDALQRRRVLVVRIGAMGDVLHALPAVCALRRAHPEWEIGWAIEPRWVGLLRDSAGSMPVVDRVHLVPTRAWKQRPFSKETVREIAGLRRELRAARYDVCVDMQGTIRSAVVGWMAGAERMVGMDEPRETPAGWMYGERVKVTAAHVVEQECEVLGAAAGVALEPTAVRLPADAEAEAWCEELVRREGSRWALMAPTAGWRAKAWPAERFGAVAAALGRAGLRTLVNAASAEDGTARQVVAASEGFAVAVPCSVAQMMAMVRRAEVVIAGDTGPLHLAAALERPVVGLFGPTDPRRTGPYGTRSRVLRDEASVTSHARVRETEAGLKKIGVDAVVAAAREVMGWQVLGRGEF